MMDTKKMREEFEAWQAKETPGSDLLRIGNNEESYRNMYVAERWIGWKASRESMTLIIHRRRGIYPDADDYEAAIEVAGLRTEYAPETGITAS